MGLREDGQQQTWATGGEARGHRAQASLQTATAGRTGPDPSSGHTPSLPFSPSPPHAPSPLLRTHAVRPRHDPRSRTRSNAFKRALVAELVADALPRLASGRFESVIDRQFSGLAQAQAAHDYLESNGNAGKVVLLNTLHQ